jgi:hypothetical protein
MVLRGTELMAAKQEYAKEWLKKEKGIKLRTTSRRGNHNDPNAFGAGMSDGKKADFRRESAAKIGAHA